MPSYASGHAAILGWYFSTGDRKVPSLFLGKKQAGRSFESLFFHLGDKGILDHSYGGQNPTLLP